MNGLQLSHGGVIALLLLFPTAAHASGLYLGAPIVATFIGILLLPASLVLIISFLIIRGKPEWPDKKWKFYLYFIMTHVQIILFVSLGAWLAYQVYFNAVYSRLNEKYEALPILFVIAVLVRTHIVTRRVVVGKYRHQHELSGSKEDNPDLSSKASTEDRKQNHEHQK